MWTLRCFTPASIDARWVESWVDYAAGLAAARRCLRFQVFNFNSHFRSNGVRRKRSAGTNVADSTTDSAGLGKQGIYWTDDVQYKENNGLLERFWYVSTQLNEHLWTQVLKHPNVHICLVTSVCHILQSAWFAYWSVADSGQVGRKIIKHLGASKTYLNVLWTDKQYHHQGQKLLVKCGI